MNTTHKSICAKPAGEQREPAGSKRGRSNHAGSLRSPAGLLALFLVPTLALAGDWPQFLGPTRDGVSTETGLRWTWDDQGPPLLWAKPVGAGYSGPVSAGERLILFHRVGNQEIVECLNAANGQEQWRFSYRTEFEDDFRKGDGPRATPTITGQRVITYGADGWLHCLHLETGQKVWGRNVLRDCKAPPNFFGVGSSPVVDGKLVLVNVGGPNAGIIAFDLASGREVWKATSDGASYASPVVATVGGQRRAVFFTRAGVVLLRPEDGSVLFRQRWRARIDASVNAATPLVIDDLAFFSASYETGALLLRLHKDGADEVWSNDEAMSNHYNTCVYYQGNLYGFDGRQEKGPRFRCVELKTGKIHWTQERFGCGAMVLAGGHLVVLTESGQLLSVEATPTAYREKARARVLAQPPCRAQIALAQGRLYGRDQKKLACWDLRK